MIGFKVINNAISTEDCAAIIEWSEQQEGWQRSNVVNYSLGITEKQGATNESRTSDSLPVALFSYDHPDCVQAMGRAVWFALKEYSLEYGITYYTVEAASLNRYQPGQEFHSHHDYFQGSDRVVSALVYLNEVEGGETEFPRFDTAYKPEPGRIVIFPSNFIYNHIAKPPTKGTKYAAAFWARG